MREFSFNILDTAFNKALLLTGSMIFSIFLKIAMFSGFCNISDDLGTLDRFEFIELFAQFFGAAYC